MIELDTFFVSLRIPSEYGRFQRLCDDQEALKSLTAWKNKAHNELDALNNHVARARTEGEPLNDALLADLIFYVMPYAIESENDGLDLAPWSTPAMQLLAFDILSFPQISRPTIALLRQVLSQNLRIVFSSNLHPHLNNKTGKRLARPAGGPHAVQDYYDEQTWKNYPGIWSVLAWVVKNITPDAYEDIWHLLIPPTMTLLDDYQAEHKLEGVRVISFMLHTIPQKTLLRTGVNELIFSSLKTGLSHLSDPETPTLLRLVIATWLNLALKVDEPNSFELFDHLSALVVSSIIEGIWIYSTQNIVAMKATLDSLPDVLRTLGIATVGFLKSLIPQLAHIMAMRSTMPDQSENVNDIIELQKSAGRVMLVIIDVGACRMEGWKFTILDGVVRCWVELVESNGSDLELQDILREIMSKLATACPDIFRNAYKALLMEDENMFSGLVDEVVTSSQRLPDFRDYSVEVIVRKRV